MDEEAVKPRVIGCLTADVLLIMSKAHCEFKLHLIEGIKFKMAATLVVYTTFDLVPSSHDIGNHNTFSL